MNEQELYALAESLAPLTEEEQIEYVGKLDSVTAPSAEDLAKVSALVKDIKAGEEVPADDCEAPIQVG